MIIKNNDLRGLIILNKLNDYNIRQILMQIKGVGSWTADIYLLMALRRPDIWPKGDIALAKSMKKVKRLKTKLLTRNHCYIF